jgi:hypothetical protein
MPFIAIDTFNYLDIPAYKVHTTSVVGGPLVSLHDCRAGSQWEGKLFDGWVEDYRYTHLAIYEELRGKAYYRELVAACAFDTKKRHIESLRANRASDHVQEGMQAALDYMEEQFYNAVKDEIKDRNPETHTVDIGVLAIGSYDRKDKGKHRFMFDETQRGWVAAWRNAELVAKVRAIVATGQNENFNWGEGANEMKIRVYGTDAKYRAALDDLLSEGTLDRIEQTGKWSIEFDMASSFGTSNYSIAMGTTADEIDTENPRNIVYNFLVSRGFEFVHWMGVMKGTLTHVIPDEVVEENVRTYGSVAARAKTNRRYNPY